MPELALMACADMTALNPTNPFHSSAHVRGKLLRFAPMLVPIVEEHLATSESEASKIARTAESMQGPMSNPSAAVLRAPWST